MANTGHAVMTQGRGALCVYWMLAYLKFQGRISQRLQQRSRRIGLNIFAQRDLIALCKPPQSCRHIATVGLAMNIENKWDSSGVE